MIDRCNKCNVYLDILEFIFNECKEKKTKRNIKDIFYLPHDESIMLIMLYIYSNTYADGRQKR